MPGKVLVDKNVDNVKNFAVQGEIHISTLLSTACPQPFAEKKLQTGNEERNYVDGATGLSSTILPEKMLES